MLERLKDAFTRLTRDADFEGAVKELQRALIGADVDVELVAQLTRELREAYRKKEAPPGIPKRDYILKLMYEKLVELLGGKVRPFPIVPQRILLVGLFGSGKTTTAAKLGLWLKKRGLSVLLVCADTHRPAACDQLRQLAEKAGLRFFPAKGSPEETVEQALEEKTDVYIVDTAGRSALDEELMEELKRIKRVLIPEKTLLVVPADAGSYAGREAEEFQKNVGIDGVIITKMDSSGKGGGALTACARAGVPVYFVGTGEHLEDFEPFNAERFLKRILGVPDLESLLERAKEAEVSVEDILEGPFDINAFYKQLKATQQMGPLDKVFSMLGLSPPREVVEEARKKFKKYDAIYKSMTKYERSHPEVLSDPSRIRRIAKGSGTSEADVRAFLRDYWRAEKLFRKLKRKRKYVERMLEKGKLVIP